MDQVDPKERVFFSALDGELEKIEHFYKRNIVKLLILIRGFTYNC
jgi:hypothetical protein